MDPLTQQLSEMSRAKRADAYRAGEDFGAWQARARTQLGALLGIDRLEKCEPRVHVEETREEQAFVERRITFDTQEKYEAVAHLLIPRGVRRPPVAICLQGHSTGMHISLGQPKYPGDEETISGEDLDFARQAISRGFAALALEQRGFGERGGDENGPHCQAYAMGALMLGRTLIGERVWDVMRALDMLKDAFPEVDASRALVMGNSGGGTTAIYAAAMEPRLAACMSSCAFSGFEASIGAQLHCVCNYVPGILDHFDMGDIAALIAPRPLVIVSGQSDGIFPLKEAREQFAVAEACYRAAGTEGNCRHIVGPEGHRFYADLAWPVMEALMAGRAEGGE